MIRHRERPEYLNLHRGLALSFAGCLIVSGCTNFMAGWRSANVRTIGLGTTQAGVAAIAGDPQRREALTTPTGNAETWYYVVIGPGGSGTLEEYPILFANAQVVAVGREGVAAYKQPPAQTRGAAYPASTLESQPQPPAGNSVERALSSVVKIETRQREG